MAATKRSVNGRQLLLLAALLFGIVTMHTLGHPTGHSTGHSSSATSDHSTGRSTSHAGGAEQAAEPLEMSGGGTGHARTAASAPAPSPAAAAKDIGLGNGGHEHAGPPLVATSVPTGTGGTDGMDPLSVCLAVLAALTLVLLLRAGLLRPGGFAAPARPLARLLDGLRPNPPPPRILLSRLSVLRI